MRTFFLICFSVPFILLAQSEDDIAIEAVSSIGEAWSNSQLQSDYLEIVQDAGYDASIDGDGDVAFVVDGLNYYVQIFEDDPAYFRLILPNIQMLETDEQRVRAHETASILTGRFRVAKLFVTKDRVWVSAEMFLTDPDQAADVLDRCIKVVSNAREGYFQMF